MSEVQQTHHADCWKDPRHRKCAERRKSVLWNQYLSDGTDATLKKWEEVKWFLLEGGISL